MWNIIGTDNFARDEVADFLVADNIANQTYAIDMASALNKKYCVGDYAPTFYKAVPQDYRLSRGMEDFM